MAIGPFPSFSFPGVYTQTLNEAPRVTAAGGLRVPAFIGVADEVIPVTAYEMIRGSSSMADNKVNLEEMISSTDYPIDGINRSFKVTYFPITTGSGTGTTTTNPNDVTAYVNSVPVPVAAVAGGTGVVSLVSAPAVDDVVEISYYFKRKDIYHASENLSLQADSTNVAFKVDYVPIVTGNNGGTTSTDPSTVVVSVNSTPVTASAVDGASGTITLPTPPAAGSTVQVAYYSNDYQDTFDILPTHNVAEITRVGYSPNTTDFYNGTDYVLDTTGSFATLNWGNSYKITRGTNTLGYTYFYDQITASLYDNRVYRQDATWAAGSHGVDGTNKTFIIPLIPTMGDGRGKITDDPSKLTAYVGSDPTSATPVSIAKMSGGSRTITLATAPAAGQNVYVTEYQNLLTDDVWTLTDTTSGASDVGTYSMVGAELGTAWDVTWSSSDTTVNALFNGGAGKAGIEYPDGTGYLVRDTQVTPGYGVEELVTLSFYDSTTYVVSSDNIHGTGSTGDNTGYLNRTYRDSVTGFRVTLTTPSSAGDYSGNPGLTADKIGYKVSSNFVTETGTPTRAIPGVKLLVKNTTGVNVGDTGVITTYNKSGAEPSIGDFYYVTFNQEKSFDSDGLLGSVFVTTEKNALAYTGPLNVNNKLALAAHLAFLNGAGGVILKQILKTTGGTDAPTSEYQKAIDSFNLPMEGGLRPALMEPVTSSKDVLVYTKTSNTIQSSIRYANERMTYFGFPIGTTPTQAQSLAMSYNNERMTGLYPDGAVVVLTDEVGNNTEFLVDGSLLAAAVAGRDTSPAFDVAEPLTRKPVVGFTRLYRRLDTVTQAQVANAGVTILEEQSAGILVKIDLTTDVTSVLTRTPSVIRIKDFVQQGIRNALMPYIGQKFLVSRTVEITSTVKSYLSSLVQANIITAFSGVSVVPDPTDPTTVQVTATYSPVLPLLWIVVTFNLRTRA